VSGAQGRFQNVDPTNAGTSLSDPQTWNGYSYVDNNPLTYTDPSGEGWLSWLGIGLGIAGAFFGLPVGIALVGAHTAATLGTVLTIGGTLASGGSLATGGGILGIGGITSTVNDGPWNEQPPWGINATNPSTNPSGLPATAGGCDFGVCGQIGNSYTGSIGLAVNGTFPFGISFTYFGGIVIDHHGHVAFFKGWGYGVGAGAGASLGVQAGVSNANTVCGIGGPFDNVSGTGGGEAAATIDYYQGRGDGPGGRVRGGGATVGVGGGASSSAYRTDTVLKPVGKFHCPN